MARYEARRRGRIGQLGVASYRAELQDTATGTAADVANLELAEQIADLLNRADRGELPPQLESDAPLPHYEAFRDPKDLELTVVARFKGAYPDLFVARTHDRELADRIAGLLNRVDPGKKIRVKHGIGWW